MQMKLVFIRAKTIRLALSGKPLLAWEEKHSAASRHSLRCRQTEIFPFVFNVKTVASWGC